MITAEENSGIRRIVYRFVEGRALGKTNPRYTFVVKGHFSKARSGAPPVVSLDVKKTNPRHTSSLKWPTRHDHVADDDERIALAHQLQHREKKVAAARSAEQ